MLEVSIFGSSGLDGETVFVQSLRRDASRLKNRGNERSVM